MKTLNGKITLSLFIKGVGFFGVENGRKRHESAKWEALLLQETLREC